MRSRPSAARTKWRGRAVGTDRPGSDPSRIGQLTPSVSRVSTPHHGLPVLYVAWPRAPVSAAHRWAGDLGCGGNGAIRGPSSPTRKGAGEMLDGCDRLTAHPEIVRFQRSRHGRTLGRVFPDVLTSLPSAGHGATAIFEVGLPLRSNISSTFVQLTGLLERLPTVTEIPEDFEQPSPASFPGPRRWLAGSSEIRPKPRMSPPRRWLGRMPAGQKSGSWRTSMGGCCGSRRTWPLTTSATGPAAGG